MATGVLAKGRWAKSVSKAVDRTYLFHLGGSLATRAPSTSRPCGAAFYRAAPAGALAAKCPARMAPAAKGHPPVATRTLLVTRSYVRGSWLRYQRSDRTLHTIGAPGLTTNGASTHRWGVGSMTDRGRRLDRSGRC